MLTKEQEEKIREAVAKGYEWGTLTAESVRYAIVMGIRAYDEIRDVEEVKAAVKKAAESNSDAYMVFRPHEASTKKELEAIRVFNSKDDMIAKLSKEYNGKIVIEVDENELNCIGWFHQNRILAITDDSRFKHIGYCDCKTFKRG